MTVRRGDTGTVILDGVCAVEDAEPLLQMLQATPAAAVDWTRCRQLHTAVLQVIMASGTAPIGPCGDAWVTQWLEPKLPQKEEPADSVSGRSNGTKSATRPFTPFRQEVRATT